SRGVAGRRIATGTVSIPSALQAELPGTPVFPAGTAVSSNGTSIWLVRDTGDHGRTTVVDRFDGQTLSPLAHIVLSSTGPGVVRSRVVALSPDRVAIVREHFESLILGAADWYFLDPQLEVIASYADDSGHRLPAGGECSADVQRSPANAEWLVLCSDSSLSGDGALVFLDPNTFTISATVSLPRERGFAIGMASATDGTVYVRSHHGGRSLAGRGTALCVGHRRRRRAQDRAHRAGQSSICLAKRTTRERPVRDSGGAEANPGRAVTG